MVADATKVERAVTQLCLVLGFVPQPSLRKSESGSKSRFRFAILATGCR